jgi:hypothetical protein
MRLSSWTSLRRDEAKPRATLTTQTSGYLNRTTLPHTSYFRYDKPHTTFYGALPASIITHIILCIPHILCYLYYTPHTSLTTYIMLPVPHTSCYLFQTSHSVSITHLMLLVQHTSCYLYHHLMLTAPHNTCYLNHTPQTVPHTLTLPLTYTSRVPHTSRYLSHTINITCTAHLMPSFHTSRTPSTTWTPCSNTLKWLQGENYWQTS